MHRRPIAALALPALAALALAGCGGTDKADLEEKLADQFETQTGQKADSVSCPDRASDAKEGDKFDCDVKVEGGGEATASVSVVNEDLDFTVTFAVADGAPDEESPEGEEPAGDEGASAEDEQAIAEIVDAVAQDAAALCGVATEELLDELGGPEGCAEAAAEEDPDPDFEISDLTVEGDSATVTGSGKDGEQTITFVRGEDGGWLVASVE